jgi:predicted CoA-substrate-specific enzyme activase
MKHFIGIDIGSSTTKLVLLNSERQIIDWYLKQCDDYLNKNIKNLLNDVLEKNNLNRSQVYIMSTGSKRHNLEFSDDIVTEISAQARGVFFFHPSARSVIEIGSRTTKAIIISPKKGTALYFLMNESSTVEIGSFLENIAYILEVPINYLGSINLKSKIPNSIRSSNFLFAETEVIDFLFPEIFKNEIIARINESIAEKVAYMAKRLCAEPPLIITGGVAKNNEIKKHLEIELGFEIIQSKHPQYTGAIGAALIGLDKYFDKMKNSFIYKKSLY